MASISNQVHRIARLVYFDALVYHVLLGAAYYIIA